LRKLVGRTIQTVPWLRRQWYVSTDYELVTEEQARHCPAGGWFSPLTAWRQERAYLAMLAEMRAGHPRADLTVAAEAVDAIGLKNASLLEIGCGSGYYRDVFAQLPVTMVDYTGIDYSHAMIARARKRYPEGNFAQQDATALTFADGSFDIAFNGVSLMHILDYKKAIAESRRVARHACIFHCVPVFAARETAYIRKYAYGAPVAEIVFNRAHLVHCFEECGLSVVKSWTGLMYDVHTLTGEHSVSETFLCVPSASASAAAGER
jgi:ubiquinone/menaquinone biosynthesis C-methylase UbiE